MRYASQGWGWILLALLAGCDGGYQEIYDLPPPVGGTYPEPYSRCPDRDEGWCIFFADGSQISIRANAFLQGTLDAGPIRVPIQGAYAPDRLLFQICGLEERSIGTLEIPEIESGTATAVLTIGDVTVRGTVTAPGEEYAALAMPFVNGTWSAALDTQPVDAVLKFSQHGNLLLLAVSGSVITDPDFLWGTPPVEKKNDCPLLAGNVRAREFSFADTGATGATFTGEFNGDLTAATAVQNFPGSVTQAISLRKNP